MNSLSSDVKYVGERSNVGETRALLEVGGRVILMKEGSRCDEYDSRACTNSVHVSAEPVPYNGTTYS